MWLSFIDYDRELEARSRTLFILQDSDWEEVHAEDVEADKDLLYSAGITSLSKPSHGHLEAMANVFNEVFCLTGNFYVFKACHSSILLIHSVS